MNIFLKYEFLPEEWNTLKPLLKDINCSIVEIGFICFQLDEEENCINLSNKWAVDILWGEEPFKQFMSFEVYPNPVGVHTFYGDDNLYLKSFCAKYPESEYCVLPEPII
jgi:hypothetical protein